MQAPSSGREGGSNLYIRRHVLDRASFVRAQGAVVNALANHRYFHKRPLERATASLLSSADIRFVLNHSRALRIMPFMFLRQELLDSLPSTGLNPLHADVDRVEYIQKRNKHIAILLQSEQLEDERYRLRQRLASLGHLTLDTPDLPCHISLGTFDRQLPKGVISALDEVLPDTFVLHPVTANNNYSIKMRSPHQSPIMDFGQQAA